VPPPQIPSVCCLLSHQVNDVTSYQADLEDYWQANDQQLTALGVTHEAFVHARALVRCAAYLYTYPPCFMCRLHVCNPPYALSATTHLRERREWSPDRVLLADAHMSDNCSAHIASTLSAAVCCHAHLALLLLLYRSAPASLVVVALVLARTGYSFRC
jgi:hypothetical protein